MGRLRAWFWRHWRPREVGPLDISESATTRAARQRDHHASSKWGIVGLAALSGAGGVVAALVVRAPLWVRVSVGAGVAVMAVVFGLFMIYVVCLVCAPVSQRDQARKRLRQIKTEAHRYGIEPVPDSAFLVAPTENPEQGHVLRVGVLNSGRGSYFAVTLRCLDGIEETLLDETTPLYWMGRRQAIDEEIPSKEERGIGVGFVQTDVDGDGTRFSFTPMGPDAERWGRHYKALAGETITAWIRVSVRRVPEIGYWRDIGVTAKWDGPGHDVHAGIRGFAPDHECHAPSFAWLLEWVDELGEEEGLR